jgi:hypothetical protein
MSLGDITTKAMRGAFAQYAETHKAASIQRCWSTWNVLCAFLYTSDLIPSSSDIAACHRTTPSRSAGSLVSVSTSVQKSSGDRQPPVAFCIPVRSVLLYNATAAIESRQSQLNDLAVKLDTDVVRSGYRIRFRDGSCEDVPALTKSSERCRLLARTGIRPLELH